MKKIAWLIGVAALIGSAGYLVVYVGRWQWNRALFSGIAMIATLVALGIAMVLRRLSQLEARLAEQSGSAGADGGAFRRDLEATRPRRDHFAWLEDATQQPTVFITLLLGGGVIVSGLSWLVGKVAERTTTPSAESGLAERMQPLTFPARGLAPTGAPGDTPAARLLRGPGGGGR